MHTNSEFLGSSLISAHLRGLHGALRWPIAGSDNGAGGCVYHTMGADCSPEKGDFGRDEEQGTRRDERCREVLQVV
jgi:hypothetical protein